MGLQEHLLSASQHIKEETIELNRLGETGTGNYTLLELEVSALLGASVEESPRKNNSQSLDSITD